MFGWIPIIGPIINGITSIFNKALDIKAIKYKVDGTVDIAAIKAANDLAIATQTDIGVRLARDLIMFPVAMWTALISWDNMVLHKYPHLVWTVERYPPGMEYLPYAVITFLFGATAMILWKR